MSIHTTTPISNISSQTSAAAAHYEAAAALCEQPDGQPCLLLAITADGRLGQRLADMGFLAGLGVRVVRRAPLGDPLEVDLAGVRLCIRAEEARHVLVRPLENMQAEAGVRR